MTKEENYKVIITNEGILIFLIRASESNPVDPILLYDGREKATLYRSENEAILFDSLDRSLLPILREAKKILVFELDDEIEDILRTYEAPVKYSKCKVSIL